MLRGIGVSGGVDEGCEVHSKPPKLLTRPVFQNEYKRLLTAEQNRRPANGQMRRSPAESYKAHTQRSRQSNYCHRRVVVQALLDKTAL